MIVLFFILLIQLLLTNGIPLSTNNGVCYETGPLPDPRNTRNRAYSTLYSFQNKFFSVNRETIVYSPEQDKWTEVRTATITSTYESHFAKTSALLTSNKVFISKNTFTDQRLAEIFDPQLPIVFPVFFPSGDISNQEVVALENDKALLIGGLAARTFSSYSIDPQDATSSCFLYDKSTITPTQNLPVRLFNHRAVRLKDGNVIVFGGTNELNVPQSGSYVYLVISNTWTQVGSMLTPRANHDGILLNNGNVLTCGGISLSSLVVTSCEVYVPAFRQWVSSRPLSQDRSFFTLTLLLNGKVQAIGGRNDSGIDLQTSEIYDPINDVWVFGASLKFPRRAHSAVLLGNDRILIIGSGNEDGIPLLKAEICTTEGPFRVSNSIIVESQVAVGVVFSILIAVFIGFSFIKQRKLGLILLLDLLLFIQSLSALAYLTAQVSFINEIIQPMIFIFLFFVSGVLALIFALIFALPNWKTILLYSPIFSFLFPSYLLLKEENEPESIFIRFIGFSIPVLIIILVNDLEINSNVFGLSPIRAPSSIGFIVCFSLSIPFLVILFVKYFSFTKKSKEEVNEIVLTTNNPQVVLQTIASSNINKNKNVSNNNKNMNVYDSDDEKIPMAVEV